MIRAIVSIALLLSSVTLVRAQAGCTRSMLQAAADSYIAAQTAGESVQNVARSKGEVS